MTCNIDLHGKEDGKYNISFNYSRTDVMITSWIRIDDNEGNYVYLYFRTPKQIADFISELMSILSSQRYAELIAEGAK
jgi:hypothetical protein